MRFVAAYRNMADSHAHVCARFAGENGNSLSSQDRDPIRSLRRFGENRSALVDPAAGKNQQRRGGPATGPDRGAGS
jgi:hypothetical protein